MTSDLTGHPQAVLSLEALHAEHGTLAILQQLATLETEHALRHRARLEFTPATVSGRLAEALRAFTRQAAADADGLSGGTMTAAGRGRDDPDTRAWSGRGRRGGR